MSDATCILIENGVRCTEPVKVKKYGWCRRHWRRWQYAGDPLAPDRRHEKRDPEARFFEKVDKNGGIPARSPELGPCWTWTGATAGGQAEESAYGTFWDDGTHHRAHRWSYEHFVRSIPEGLEIDHLCHPGDGSCPAATCSHHRCVNPAHLEPVTHRENGIRGNTFVAAHAAATHCPKGHPYDEENTRRQVLPNGNIGRGCKKCNRRPPTGRPNKLAIENAAKAHCPQGHPYDEENTFYIKGGVGRRCKICMKATWARRNAKVRAQRLAQQQGSLF